MRLNSESRIPDSESLDATSYHLCKPHTVGIGRYNTRQFQRLGLVYGPTTRNADVAESGLISCDLLTSTHSLFQKGISSVHLYNPLEVCSHVNINVPPVPSLLMSAATVRKIGYGMWQS